MGMSIEIPTDLQPAIEAAIAKGGYANEQELVSEIVWAAVPALEVYGQLRRDVQASVQEIEQGKIREADFNAIRDRLSDEYDDSGNRK
jgi:Arc/MetJ-type ribon-helix-helix transcriptional regulator